MVLNRPVLAVWLAAIVGVAITVRLGLWQLDRAAQKVALGAAQTQRTNLPPLAPDALARAETDAEPQWYRTITVRGRWLADKTLILDNQPLEGRAGFIAVTPLLLAPGDAVLVQRGWAPRDPADRARVPPIESPADEVLLTARIAPWPSRRFDLGADDGGQIRQNLDAAALAAQWGVRLRPLSLQELTPATAGNRWIRRWTLTSPDPVKNQGYALQWFALAALIAALTVWYRLIKPRRENRR